MEKLAKCKVCKGTNLKYVGGKILCLDCETIHYEMPGGRIMFEFYPLIKERFRDETF